MPGRILPSWNGTKQAKAEKPLLFFSIAGKIAVLDRQNIAKLETTREKTNEKYPARVRKTTLKGVD